MRYEVFIVYIAALNISFDLGNNVYPSKKAQIAHLKINKVLTKVFSKYTDFEDIFLPKLIIKLPEHTRINNYAIELVDD